MSLADAAGFQWCLLLGNHEKQVSHRKPASVSEGHDTLVNMIRTVLRYWLDTCKTSGVCMSLADAAGLLDVNFLLTLPFVTAICRLFPDSGCNYHRIFPLEPALQELSARR